MKNKKSMSALKDLTIKCLEMKDPFVNFLSLNTHNLNVNLEEKSPLPHITPLVYSQALAKVRNNVIQQILFSDQNIQSCVYMIQPLVSFFNHSCYPNASTYTTTQGINKPNPSHNQEKEENQTENNQASQLFDSNKIESDVSIYSVAPIRKGDEVAISYRADLLYMSRQIRQSILFKTWNFDCKCVRCLEPVSFLNKDGSKRTDNTLTLDEMCVSSNSCTALTKTTQAVVESSFVKLFESELRDSKWLKAAESFLDLPLHLCNYQRTVVRNELMSIMRGGAYDTSLSPKIQREARMKLLKLLEESVYVSSKLLPPLHPAKLINFNTLMIESIVIGTSIKDIAGKLTALDPNYRQTNRLYPSKLK